MAEGSRNVSSKGVTDSINESGKYYRIMKRLNLLELAGRWMLTVVQMPGPRDLDARVRLAMPVCFQSGIGKMRHHRNKI